MHHPDNPASGRLLAKAGFTRIGATGRDAGTVPYEAYAPETGGIRTSARGQCVRCTRLARLFEEAFTG
jgi:ribosomal-protein-alanine N-acetyltransferase